MIVIAFDAGSPFAQAAVVDGDRLLAARSERREGDRTDLLVLVSATLAEAGVEPRALDGIAALIGPGSFTGTRIACATALGLAAATGAPATGVPTLEALALAAPGGRGRLLAVVDALRGEWFVQSFGRADGLELAAEGEAAIVRAESADLVSNGGIGQIVGFDAARFAAAAGSTVELVERPEPSVAAAHAAAAGRWPWDPSRLSHPHYLRAPAISGRR